MPAPELTLADVVAYSERHPYATARKLSHRHTGTLGVTSTYPGDGSEPRHSVRIRDSGRSPRTQYLTVFERDLTSEDFQVKVNSRFVSFADALAGEQTGSS